MRGLLSPWVPHEKALVIPNGVRAVRNLGSVGPAFRGGPFHFISFSHRQRRQRPTHIGSPCYSSSQQTPRVTTLASCRFNLPENKGLTPPLRPLESTVFSQRFFLNRTHRTTQRAMRPIYSQFQLSSCHPMVTFEGPEHSLWYLHFIHDCHPRNLTRVLPPRRQKSAVPHRGSVRD